MCILCLIFIIFKHFHFPIVSENTWQRRIDELLLILHHDVFCLTTLISHRSMLCTLAPPSAGATINFEVNSSILFFLHKCKCI